MVTACVQLLLESFLEVQHHNSDMFETQSRDCFAERQGLVQFALSHVQYARLPISKSTPLGKPCATVSNIDAGSLDHSHVAVFSRESCRRGPHHKEILLLSACQL